MKKFLLASSLLAALVLAKPASAQISVLDSLGGGTGNMGVCGLNVTQPTNQFQLNQGALGGVTPLTGATVVIPPCVTFYAITPAGTIAALTVTLPTGATQGQEVEIMTSQAISSMTVNAPTNYTIQGAAISAASEAANFAIKYILNGAVWYRVQ